MKSQNYNLFWQRLHKSAKNKSKLLRVMFELTYRCNFHCRHCYIPLKYRKQKELKTQDIFSILDQLAKMGCFYLGFTGGEPFLRKDIMEILWYAKKKGFEIIVYTNGSLINKKLAKELSKLRPNKIDITIPAITKPAFERITELPNSKNKVFKAIHLLHKAGVNLGFKTCALKENKNEIKNIQKFAASLGALHRLDDLLSRRLDGSGEPYKHRQNLFKNLLGEKFDTNLRQYNDANLSPNTCLFKCGVGVNQAAITPQGKLKMCVMIDHLKYKADILPPSDLNQAWKKLKLLVASIKTDQNYKCNKCELRVFCKWCPAKAWLYNKNFTSCEPESRKKAELMKTTKL
ncbi:MAG: radical SAM protein [Candidatus Omnitrophica bacterium]|nr:radical SAM protein [Candidatus Omnitrophota bacterium]